MPSDQPLISVVVPTHNRLSYLGETLRSILAQRYNQLEVLVVADGHDQRVADLVTQLRDPRAKYLSCQFAGRPAVPRNFGIQHSRGEFIAFCDDDDLWHVDKLHKQISLMNERRADFTFTACNNIDQRGTPFGDAPLGDFAYVGKSTFLLSLGAMIVNSSIVVSRSLLNKSGPYNEAAWLRDVEDYEICTRFLMHSDAIGIREPLVDYRVHPGSIQPIKISDWMRSQAHIQAAVLENRSGDYMDLVGSLCARAILGDTRPAEPAYSCSSRRSPVTTPRLVLLV